MTPKEQVQFVYPTAFSFKLVDWYVHIKARRTGIIGWGGNAKEAWSNAASNINDQYNRKKRRTKGRRRSQ